MKVKLSKKGLAQDIENGMTRPEMAEKYGLVQGQLNKAIAMAGLKGVKAKTVKFEFVDDEEPIKEQENITEAPITNVPHSTEGVTFGTAIKSEIPTSQNFE